jgi:hypothetical protein
MQRSEAPLKALLKAIQAHFSQKCLAVIIDDFWDMHHLEKLNLALTSESSLLVTSKHELSYGWVSFQSFRITGQSINPEQQRAILASYVARDPEVDTVQPHLQVQL